MQYKKQTLLIVIIVIGVLAQGFLAKKEPQPLQQIKARFTTGLERIEAQLESYRNSAEALNSSATSAEKLKKDHLETRLAYKEVEFLIEYIDPYLVKKSINGAPLPSVEPNVPIVNVLEPTGLQVLDELVFEENLLEQKQGIIDEVARLQKTFEDAKNHLSNTRLQHRHIFEAARRSLVRILTLGVTGFDTPGSKNIVPEALATFTGIEQAIRQYIPLIDKKDKGLAIVLDARLENTRSFLAKDTGFEGFDRMVFLMEHINPLYDLLLEAHTKLGIETVLEVEKLPQPVNYLARGIFDTNFLNVTYFSNIQMETKETPARVALGRLLFFDPVLSQNNTLSCASCHQPEMAFTDGKAKSTTRDGSRTVLRNAPTLLNCVYNEHYFYDLREPKLERQILHVVSDTNEFGTDFIQIAGKLRQSNTYLALFQKAYPEIADNPVNPYSIANALANYVAQLQSFDSPFDDYVTGRSGIIQPAVTRGFNLFMGKAQCGTCHFAPVFNGTVPPLYTETESEVLGVPISTDKNAPIDPDEGRYANLKPRDRAAFYRYSFKTPTVRNSALTAPYMHNGVYNTLEEVVDFYNKGGGKGMGMTLEHQTLPFDNLQLNSQEQQDLVAFMKALSGPKDKYTAPEKLPEFETKPEWNQRQIFYRGK